MNVKQKPWVLWLLIIIVGLLLIRFFPYAAEAVEAAALSLRSFYGIILIAGIGVLIYIAYQKNKK